MSDFKNYLSAQGLLVISINICIDIGAHIVSLSKSNKSETYSKIFAEMYDLKIIPEELKQKLIDMVKFRNMLGHIYMEIDNEIIYEAKRF